MNDKKKSILEAAIRCFARKGYHAASIQDIVEELGISKGSLYFYFTSKEDLLLSVYQYYGDMIMQLQAERPQEGRLSPRERLVRLILRQVEFLQEHRSFLCMQMQEKPLSLNDELRRLLFGLRAGILDSHRRRIVAAYGEEAEPYALDGATLLGGMLSEYLFYILFYDKALDPEQLAEFIVDRVDDTMTGMMGKARPPLLGEAVLSQLLEGAGGQTPGRVPAWKEAVRELQALIQAWNGSEEGIRPGPRRRLLPPAPGGGSGQAGASAGADQRHARAAEGPADSWP
ncbi:TetR/AcrR family transcriptional regulator [Paenibacillus sp. CC-CFT747]|nr:TetR/AcrR family transcriptional regulator [Paenibacillus sp. CC-CFT747]